MLRCASCLLEYSGEPKGLTDDVSRTASVAITLRVRELHVVVIFDLAFWSANPPGRRCDMDGSQRGLGATGCCRFRYSCKVLLSVLKRFDSSRSFPCFCPPVSSICFVYVCIMFRSPDLPEALPSRMGMLRAPPHHVPGILGQFWDGLGRLGTAVGPSK